MELGAIKSFVIHLANCADVYLKHGLTYWNFKVDPIAPPTPAVPPACVMNSATLTADTTNDYWHLQLLSPPSLINPSKISECPSLLLFPDPTSSYLFTNRTSSKAVHKMLGNF